MAPDHFCVNHPTHEALSFCHHCHEWLCDQCVQEGLVYYYCRKSECQAALQSEGFFTEKRCPSCRSVMDTDAEKCHSCGFHWKTSVPLETNEDLVTVGIYKSTFEANVVKTKLESEGIESYLIGDTPHSRYGGGPNSEIVVQTKTSDAQRAIQILNEKQD